MCTAWQTNDKKSRHTYKTHSEQRVTAILNRGNILFEIRKGGDSHIIFIHVTCPSLKKLRKLKNQFWVFFFQKDKSTFITQSYPIWCYIGLNRVSYIVSNFQEWIYTTHENNFWEGGVWSWVWFYFVQWHFIYFFFRMSWCSINQFTLLSIYLAYFSQLIKGFVLFPLHPVLYVKVGSSSCYLYMRQILAQWRNYCKNQAGSHKKKMDCYRISLRYISVIFFFIDEWHTCRIFVVLHYLLYICIYM